MTTQAERLAARFQSHRRALIALARQLPESAAPFKPWAGAVSTLDLLLHIAGTGEFFLASALHREPLAVTQGESIASAAEALIQLAEKEAAEITALTDDQLEQSETIPALNLTLQVADIITLMIDHEAHHKGQAFVYARMQGVQPPFFVA